MSNQELDPNFNVFGRLLRAYRERRQVGLRELAASIGIVDAASISRWENGLQMPRIGQADAIFLICERLTLSPQEAEHFYRVAGFGTPEERRAAMQKATSSEMLAMPKPKEIKPDTDKELPNLESALRAAHRMPPAARIPRRPTPQEVPGWWSRRTEPLPEPRPQPVRSSAWEQMVDTLIAEQEA